MRLVQYTSINMRLVTTIYFYQYAVSYNNICLSLCGYLQQYIFIEMRLVKIICFNQQAVSYKNIVLSICS